MTMRHLQDPYFRQKCRLKFDRDSVTAVPARQSLRDPTGALPAMVTFLNASGSGVDDRQGLFLVSIHNVRQIGHAGRLLG
jgi:hypothetical protein